MEGCIFRPTRSRPLPRMPRGQNRRAPLLRRKLSTLLTTTPRPDLGRPGSLPGQPVRPCLMRPLGPVRRQTPPSSGVPWRSWTSSLRDHEGEHPESLYSVDEEREDSFTFVLDLIRRVNSLEKPARGTPSRSRITVALRWGLQWEPLLALNLPPSELLKALVGDVNSTLDKFIEEQTPNAFIPLQMKRQRRYYRISEPMLAAPYAVPPGLVSLTLDKATEPKKRSVTIPHDLVPFETALAGGGRGSLLVGLVAGHHVRTLGFPS